jgi:uncharacterized protein
MTRRAGWPLLAAIVTLYGLVTATAGVYLAEGVVRPDRRPVTDADRRAAADVAAAHDARLEDVENLASDGVRLRGWLFTPAAGHTDSVLVLHGQASNRAGMLSYIDLLLSAGFQVLAPDARAHGNSEGGFASYGVVESADVRAWANRLRQRNGDRCAYGFGESMGAGTLLQALDGDRTFCGVVVESAFASFREVAYDRIGSAFHTGPWAARTALRPIVDAGLLYVRARYGVHLGHADPLAAIRLTTVPVLLIHGTHDTSIPVRHSRLLAAARPAGTTVWEVPDADHCGALSVAPAEFTRQLLAALAAHPPVADASVPSGLHKR